MSVIQLTAESENNEAEKLARVLPALPDVVDELVIGCSAVSAAA
jgi:hypothetical protein